MLKILIADDDKIIRHGLRVIIENNAPEFLIVGEASNGEFALEAIKTLAPDILIVDIKMPVMDGMELIKSIKNLNIDIKTIVLSGFDEYRYIRETMKNGAVDYLLKPVENEVLLELLNKIRADIVAEKKSEQQARCFSEKVMESLVILKEKFLKELAKGNDVAFADYTQKMGEFGICGAQLFLMAIICMDDFHSIKRQMSKGKNTSIISVIRQHIVHALNVNRMDDRVLMAESENQVMMLFTDTIQQEEDFEYNTVTLIEKTRETVKSREGLSFTVGVSKVFENISRTHIAYHQAVFALQRRFYDGKNKVIVYVPEDSLYNDLNDSQLDEEICVLINCIEIGDYCKAKKAAGTIFDKIMKNNVAPERFREILSNVIRKVYTMVQDFKEVVENYTAEDFDLLFHIEELDTLEELKEYVLNTFYKVTQVISLERSEKSKKVIEIAKDYIKKHYKGNISLKTISEYVYLNSSYFSELFKDETGKNFIDYLIETRIDAAKKLLSKPEIKVYQVGQMVGYNEPVSFNRAFKKIVGISPVEYRNIIK